MLAGTVAFNGAACSEGAGIGAWRVATLGGRAARSGSDAHPSNAACAKKTNGRGTAPSRGQHNERGGDMAWHGTDASNEPEPPRGSDSAAQRLQSTAIKVEDS